MHNISIRSSFILSYYQNFWFKLVVFLFCIAMFQIKVFAQGNVTNLNKYDHGRGKISSNDSRKIHKLKLADLGEKGLGWEIILSIDKPLAVDLDLEVHSTDPTKGSYDLVCSSESTGKEERCRINESALQGKDVVWLYIYPAEGSGKTDYNYKQSILKRPLIQGTGLYGSDAMNIPKKTKRKVVSSRFLKITHLRWNSSTFILSVRRKRR